MDHSSGTLQSPSTYSESSKTTSSKSAASADKKTLSEDNVVSFIDLECHIQAERIKKILDEAIYKSKLALCLPNLVKEYTALSCVLSSQHMDDLVFIFEQYDNPMFSNSLMNVEALDDIKSGDISMKNRLNPELGLLLYIMNSYPALKPKVEAMVEKMKSDYSSTHVAKPQSSLEYVLAMEQFREIMIDQMSTSAAEELAIKFKTRKLEALNAKLIQKIAETSTSLKEESEHFQETMKLKSEMIAKLEHELVTVYCDETIKLKKKILDSERQMVLAARSHKVRNDMLKEEEVECKEAYEHMLQQHIIDEKNQRTRRFKVETQLVSWLQKYDLEMANKQVELDDYTDKYDDEIKKCEELELRLLEQDKEYIPLMAEREEEYHQEMMAKMEKFRLEHAVKVIQTAWREVQANRNEKKKLKILVKRKEAAQAAAAAAAAAVAAVAALAEKKAAAAAKKQAAEDKKQADADKKQADADKKAKTED